MRRQFTLQLRAAHAAVDCPVCGHQHCYHTPLQVKHLKEQDDLLYPSPFADRIMAAHRAWGSKGS